MDEREEPDFLAPQAPEKPGFRSNLVEFFQTLVLFAAIGTAIYWLVAQPHKVSGSSMFPTFKDGDYIITDKVSYKVGQPKKGDVVVFRNPRDESQDFIKRIMGVPGDTVKVQDSKVYVNDKLVDEPYLDSSVTTRPGAFLRDGQEIFVEPGKYIVFGDNRSHSSDSREWGYVETREIIGKVFFRYWPLSEAGIYSPK